VESGSTVRLWPGWMKRPSGWMTVRAGGVRGCFIYIPKNTLGRNQGLLHQKPSYIDCIKNTIFFLHFIHCTKKTRREFFIYYANAHKKTKRIILTQLAKIKKQIVDVVTTQTCSPQMQMI
jgi:hypothetical protein